MRIGATTAHDVYETARFDSKFFLDDGQMAHLRVNSGRWPLVSVGKLLGNENIWMPNRFIRVPARSAQHGKPILVPYDCFRYMPYSKQYLSRTQVAEYERAEIQRGWLLITRSGRNLGPVVIVDEFLSQFTVSDDMIRISVTASDDLLYFAALMHTKTGQALIRRDRNGSVIDHLSPEQVAAMRIPLLSDSTRKVAVSAFSKSLVLREEARLSLSRLGEAFLRVAGLADEGSWAQQKHRSRRFSVGRRAITDRFDVEPFAPLYAVYQKRIAANCATPISCVADVLRPPGRYKTLYVTDEAFGVKVLSGRQVAQARTIGLKVMSRAAWDRPAEYLLKKDMVLITADGRAEENLADCVLVRKDREDWAASGHVHRLVPKKGTHPGLLYLACACTPVQVLLKSRATGSVVDALSTDDVGSIIIPFPGSQEAKALGDQAIGAWDKFAKATRLEDQAVAELETEILDAGRRLSPQIDVN